ncbi:MAG: DUF4838 domain-containing protein [Lentisphaeria bacterium]|nr:DUF4838 domain-containing protein [Lentisphaeria bacterium]
MMSARASAVMLVENGLPCACIVLPRDASPRLKEAAVLLRDTIARRTDVTLAIVEEGDGSPVPTQVHLGPTAYARSLDWPVQDLDMDGYMIGAADGQHLILAGGSDWGVEYAVCELLERWAGVRWLFPGPLGECVPRSPGLAVEGSRLRAEPAFRHRLFSGLGKEEAPPERGQQGLWARRNRMHGRVAFHHNLWRLFPPEQYTVSHPEFFPELAGGRFLPKPAPGKTTAQDAQAQVSWQPCFTAPGSVEEAVRGIRAAFAADPELTSYSLGINDTNRHCTCASCLAMDGGEVNVLGVRDVSTSYYTWCNAVAAGVREAYPDKLFGLLAYNGAYSAPRGLRLNEALIPFITYDRMKWADPDIAAAGRRHTEAWAACAPVLGWYDYIYGGQFYMAPRIYVRTMGAYLRYAYQHGVRHYYAEAYPSGDWHEGPKLYVLLKLLWDPFRDVEELLDDWYRHAVGPDAAPHLARYFDRWEKLWTGPVLDTAWFRGNGARQYLDFHGTGYLDAVTVADLDGCERDLEEAVARAGEGAQRRRAVYFRDGFLRRSRALRSALRLRHPGNVTVVDTIAAAAFDAGVEGWGHWQRDYSKADFGFDPEVGHTRPGSLCVDAAGSQGTPLCFTRSVPISPLKTYRASAWFRTRALPRGGVVRISVKWKDAGQAWLNLPTAETEIQGPFADDWSRLAVCLETGEEGLWQQARWGIILLTVERAAEGRVWFDEPRFEAITVDD